MLYEHEDTGDARQGTGQTAPNPAEEIVNFDTMVFSLRYGVTPRLNLTASLPYLSINSDKFQGEFYQRENKGLGDILVLAEYAILSSPRVYLQGGLELPTGSVDKTDEFGQRICDILALGSGTTDIVIGSSIHVPDAGIKDLSATAELRHRFSGGKNKWGYRFGDLTDYMLRADYPLSKRTRLGLLAEGFHTEPDTWYGNQVPERGATFLYVGPTVSWELYEGFTVGAFVETPVLMNLEGSQMVGSTIFGLEFSTNLIDAIKKAIYWDGGVK